MSWNWQLNDIHKGTYRLEDLEGNSKWKDFQGAVCTTAERTDSERKAKG